MGNRPTASWPTVGTEAGPAEDGWIPAGVGGDQSRDLAPNRTIVDRPQPPSPSGLEHDDCFTSYCYQIVGHMSEGKR